MENINMNGKEGIIILRSLPKLLRNFAADQKNLRLPAKCNIVFHQSANAKFLGALQMFFRQMQKH